MCRLKGKKVGGEGGSLGILKAGWGAPEMKKMPSQVEWSQTALGLAQVTAFNSVRAALAPVVSLQQKLVWPLSHT